MQGLHLYKLKKGRVCPLLFNKSITIFKFLFLLQQLTILLRNSILLCSLLFENLLEVEASLIAMEVDIPSSFNMIEYDKILFVLLLSL